MLLVVFAVTGIAAVSHAGEAVRVQPTTYPFAQDGQAKKPAPATRAEASIGQVELPIFGLRAHYDENGNLTMACHLDRPTRFIAPPDAVGPHP